MIKHVVLTLVLFLLATDHVCAKSLYVSTTGNDATSYATNDIDNPWLTPLQAWTAALAGDTVYFRGGTYLITEAIVTKYIGAAGTAGSPITFRSYPGEQAVFDTNIIGYVFGIQRDYNTIYDIDFTGTAATWFYLGEDNSAHHFEIRNCTVQLGTGGDNTGFVKTSARSDYLVVENCDITGPGQDVHLNTSCLYVGSADYLTVKNNTLRSAPIGIYFKTDNDENSGNEIAYNFIYDCSRNSIQTNSQYTNFHDNIIGPDCGSFQINEDNGFALGDNNTVSHNTIFSGGLVLNSNLTGADNNTITNNIVSARTTCCDGNTWDYNLYVIGDAIGANDIANTSPTYTGGAVPSTIADYVITSESAGYLAGSDSKSMGADVALVGVDATGDLIPPEPSSAAINAGTASLLLTESVTGIPAAGDFTMDCGAGAISLSYVSGSGSSSYTLNAAAPAANGETCTMFYDGAGEIADDASNILADFTAQAMTNNTPAEPAAVIIPGRGVDTGSGAGPGMRLDGGAGVYLGSY